MGWSPTFAVGFWFAVISGLTGCGPKPAAPPDPNRLVLELGGPHEPLADTLARIRGKPAAGTAIRPQSLPSAGQGQAPPEPAPPAPTPKQKAQRQVALAKGQTIYALAKAELGDGNRWKEILKLNGWTEAQAAKLREGTPVRLPER